MLIRMILCLLFLSLVGCADLPEGGEWHVICYSGGQKTYDNYIKGDMLPGDYNIAFTEKSSSSKVFIYPSCIIRSEKIKTTPDPNR